MIPGSTPVVSFGNTREATVATLGLNPSLREFTDREGAWLLGAKRRLATTESLGLSDLSLATDDQVEQVVAECHGYFQRNPYEWFTDLENLMQVAVGRSFYDGTACHLDLVQWPTDPVWRGLPNLVRKQLIEADREFLRRQLEDEHSIRLVLLNGRTVITQVKAMGVRLRERSSVEVGSKSPSIHVGEAYGAHFIGWSENLQSGHGVTNELKRAIADEVGTQIAALSVEHSVVRAASKARHEAESPACGLREVHAWRLCGCFDA